MNGYVEDGKKVPGAMDTLDRHNRFLFGDKDADIEGVVQGMEKMRNTFKTVTVVLATIQAVATIGWMVFIHFHK